MTPQQAAKVYDSFPPEEQDMLRSEFIKRMVAATDPAKMAADADMVARGRIQKAQIDAAIGRSRSQGDQDC